MERISSQYASIEQVAGQYLSPKVSEAQQGASATSFEEILRQKQQTAEESSDLKFSKHAAMRLSDRNIDLSDEQSERLQSGVQKAGEKGIKESLVIVDSLAFIVNIPNKTVVTAMDQSEADDNIFTNIDGAVII